MHFHVQGWSCQLKALPFCLSTAPMEFTVVAKEVKLIALQTQVPPYLSPAYRDHGVEN